MVKLQVNMDWSHIFKVLCFFLPFSHDYIGKVSVHVPQVAENTKLMRIGKLAQADDFECTLHKILHKILIYIQYCTIYLKYIQYFINYKLYIMKIICLKYTLYRKGFPAYLYSYA